MLTILIYNLSCKGQNKIDSVRHYNNAVYFELGGPTLIYSLGYERTWYHNNWFSAISSVGFSYIPDGITMGYIEPGVLFRDKNVAFEMGLALMNYKERPHNGSKFNTIDESGAAKLTNLCARIGARFYTKNQHVHFRVAITPMKEIWNNDPNYWTKDKPFLFWLNVFTVGYRF